MFRAAQFLLLHPLLAIVRSRLGKHCDWKLKKLYTRNNGNANANTKSWVSDLAKAIKVAYKAELEIMKKTLMEFVWAVRPMLLGSGRFDISILVDDTPEFFHDVLRNCAARSWLVDPIWAPKQPAKSLFDRVPVKCARCKVRLAYSTREEMEGRVSDPFTMLDGSIPCREWCCKCSKQMEIPWRDASH